MALNHNSVSKDLRPLNFTRNIADEPRISVRNLEGGSVPFLQNSAQDVSTSPKSRAAFYQAAVDKDGSVAFGYPISTGVWCPRGSNVPIFVNRVGGNAAQSASDLQHGYAQSDGCSRPKPETISASGTQECSGGEGNDDLASKKVKLLCSFGGKILPRPSDGMLRYVGGQTRIISVRRGISYRELMQKMVDSYCLLGVIKYQLPDEDLDALVSVSCDEDLENMMEEYEKLLEASSEGSLKLRVFLFSACELDLSGITSFGDLQDSGQQYVDAVNGIPEGSIRRKDSTSSSSSQNSDGYAVGDIAENLGTGQGDTEALNPPLLPPRIAAASHDPARVMYMAPNNQMMFADVTAVPLNVPTISMTCPSQPYRPEFGRTGLIDPHVQFHCESDVDRSIPSTAVLLPGQHFVSSVIRQDEDSPTKLLNVPAKLDFRPEGQSLAFEDHPSVVDLPPAAAYGKTYVDGCQDAYSHADYPQNASQISYPNTQHLGHGGPVYWRANHPQQMQDNDVGMPSKPFLPATCSGFVIGAQHIGAAPPSPRVNIEQIRFDFFKEESLYGVRAQLPSDPSYRPFQPQPLPHSPAQFPGQAVKWYAWHQVLPPKHLIRPEGWVAHQPAMVSDAALKLEDCYMSQKVLPHAHSDTLLQEQGRNVAQTVSETSLSVPSFHSDGVLRSRGVHQVTAPLLEGVIEHQDDQHNLGYQGTGTWPGFIGHYDRLTDHEIAAPVLGPFRFPQILEEQCGNERVTHKVEKPDQSRLLFPPGVMGLPADLQAPYGTFAGNPPQPRQQDPFQPFVPSQYQVKQDLLMNREFGTNISSASNISSISITDTLVRDSTTGYVGKHPGLVLQGDVSNSCFGCDHLTAIDGRLEALSPSEITGMDKGCYPRLKLNLNAPKVEKSESALLVTGSRTQRSEPFIVSNANSGREETQDDRQQVAVSGTYLAGQLQKPGNVMGESYKEIEHLSSCTSVSSCFLNVQPIEPTQAVAVLGIHVGGEPLISDSLWSNKPAVSCIDATYGAMADKYPGREWKDEASQFHSRNVFNDTTALLNGCTLFSLSNSGSTDGTKGDNWDSAPLNLPFSNSDTWTVLKETHVPPPRGWTKEVSDHKGSYGGNYLGACANVCKRVGLEEGFHQPSDAEIEVSMNKDLCAEPFEPIEGSADAHIKKELQAVAEGVAASVLRSSVSPVTSLPASHDLVGSNVETNQDKEVYDNNVKADSAAGAAADELKIEDMNAKILEKNPGLPIDDIGRLQIIKNSDLEELRELGSGTFGTVYHGKWRGSDVAIKRINDRCFAGKPSEEARLRYDFWNEACKLADLHHPNVVAFYGVVLDGPGGSVATVTEYMVNGSLRHALQRNDRVLDRRKRLLIAMDVAFGMEYLHEKNIVHFDLKSDNLLVNLRDPQRPICKVGDLGLSKVKCQTLISGGVRGTLPWMAPELLNGSSNLVSEKVDVFSFGIVMWELLTREEPYADLHYGAIIGGIVSNTLRPPVPELCDPEWRLLMERCWSSEPSERPSFTEIAGMLRSMAATLPPKGQTQQSHAQSQATK